MLEDLPEPVLRKLRLFLRPRDFIALDTVCPIVHLTYQPFALVSAELLREWEQLRIRRREDAFAYTFLLPEFRSHLPLHAPNIDDFQP